MKCALSKVRSSTGASMLLGLLFLLFCLTVGAVVLTAASVGAGRTQRNRQVQQNYLAVQSAANLLMDDMEDMDFQGTFTRNYYIQWYEDEDGNLQSLDWKTWEPPAEGILAKTKFQSVLEDYFKALFLSDPDLTLYQKNQVQPPAPVPVSTELELSEPNGTHKLPAVAVTLTAGTALKQGETPEYSEEGFTVTAGLALREPAAEGSHAVQVVWEPEVKVEQETKTRPGNPQCTTTTFTCHVTWKDPVVTKPEKEATP